jgi:hypothetical protein
MQTPSSGQTSLVYLKMQILLGNGRFSFPFANEFFRFVEPLAKLLSELLQESSQDSGFSSQNFAMRWLGCGSAAVHSES